jgi:anaerobic magnesium-protoporphyrin IX monomethyl ester cyclase
MKNIVLINYDNASLAHSFPHGTAYIAAYLEQKGHDVHILSQDVYHLSESQITQYIDHHKPEVVGMGIIAGYYQYAKLIAISKAVRAAKHQCMYVLGGHGVSPEPEYFLRLTGADYIVIGEGEETFAELVELPAQAPDGVAFIKDNRFVQTPTRKQIKDIDSIPFPAYHKFQMPHYMANRQYKQYGFSVGGRYAQMISGRGCPFQCSFCYRLMDGFRARSPENIVEEIKLLQKNYNVKTIEFHDELMMSSPTRVHEICDEFRHSDLDIEWACNGRLNVAHPDVLAEMKKAGCTYINYGVEALDDTVLRNMNKHLTVDQIVTGVEATIKAGIIPGLNIMWGNIGDTPRSLRAAVRFLKKYGDGTQLRTIRPVTPYPGSPLYYHCINAGLFKNVEEFYKLHVNSDLPCVDLIKHYYGIHRNAAIAEAKHFYEAKDTTFRGFRQM